jgi:hypothetical protein
VSLNYDKVLAERKIGLARVLDAHNPPMSSTLVSDGRKALFLPNEGHAQLLNVKTKRVFTDTTRRPMSRAPTAGALRFRLRAQAVRASSRRTGTKSRSTDSLTDGRNA